MAWLPFARQRRQQRIGSTDPRAYIAGDYRNHDGSRGPEIAVADTRVHLGCNSHHHRIVKEQHGLLSPRGD